MKQINSKTGISYDNLKKQYATLKGKGLTQREIAKQLNVSAQAVSKWAKTLPIAAYYEIRNQLIERLSIASKNKETPVIDLYNLQNTLAGLEKQIKMYEGVTK